jgi:hypothetical protein
MAGLVPAIHVFKRRKTWMPAGREAVAGTNDLAAEMRSKAVQGAKLPALRAMRRGALMDGGWMPVRGVRPEYLVPQRWSRVMRMNGRLRGPRGADRLNTARGIPRVWRTCGLPCRSFKSGRQARHRTSTSLDVARRRGRGSIWLPGVPRALGSSGRRGSSLKTTAHPAPPKKQGGGALPGLFEK